MTDYKRTAYAGVLLMLSLLTGGCSADEDPVMKQQSGFSFEVHTRGTDSPDGEKQYTRLYVAERKQEHDKDHLHCPAERRYTLTDGRYELTDLYGQWYKFAFVCVPKWSEGGENLLTEEDPAERTCDFNKLLLDFRPVLMYQKEQTNIAQTEDLNIYRRVIDRWIDPDGENTEDVEMTRITGEMLIDMGIPADQFPKNVKSIRLTLNAPTMQAYIRDDASENVITVAGSGDVVYELDFSDLDEEEYKKAMATKQVFRICLLPEVLKGSIVVNYKNSNEAVYFPIGENADEGETRVEIRPNRVTTVLYNGMKKNEFEVRYAGFATGNDAEVDVDDDVWNGWNDRKPL